MTTLKNLKKMKLSKEKEDIFEEMKNRINTLKASGISNCIGTAFYIAGEKNKDRNIYRGHEEHLKKLTEKNFPEKGFLIAWCDGNEIYHLGVITNLNPLLVTHRGGIKGDVYEDHPFEEVNRIYQKIGWHTADKISYFVPKKLEEILK
jgi:hypothetical protein